MRHRVYVPVVTKILLIDDRRGVRGRSHVDIHDGSGIVGIAHQPLAEGEPEILMIDYEGAIYGQDMNYAEKVMHAASRQSMRYPTIARAWVRPETMTPVGWFYDDIGIVELSDATAVQIVAKWIGIEPFYLIAHVKTILYARGAKWGR